MCSQVTSRGSVIVMTWGASCPSPSLHIREQRPRELGSSEQALPLGLVVQINPSDLGQSLAHPKPKNEALKILI